MKNFNCPDDEVICTSHFSKLDPVENGEVHVSLVNGRPGVVGPTLGLQNFTTARYIRLRLQKIKTLYADLVCWLVYGSLTVLDGHRSSQRQPQQNRPICHTPVFLRHQGYLCRWAMHLLRSCCRVSPSVGQWETRFMHQSIINQSILQAARACTRRRDPLAKNAFHCTTRNPGHQARTTIQTIARNVSVMVMQQAAFMMLRLKRPGRP